MTDLKWLLEPMLNFKMAKLSIKDEFQLRKRALKLVHVIADQLHKIDQHLPCADWPIFHLAFLGCVVTIYEKDNVYFLQNVEKIDENTPTSPFIFFI